MPIKNVEKRREYQRVAHKRYRAQHKLKVIALLGSSCSMCGYKEDVRALEVDHIEPVRRSKKNPIEEKGARLYQLILLGKVDITKLQLLCANCHRIKTYKDIFQ